jgi:hypothetical protein
MTRLWNPTAIDRTLWEDQKLRALVLSVPSLSIYSSSQPCDQGIGGSLPRFPS